MKKILILLLLCLVSGIWAGNMLKDKPNAKRPRKWKFHHTEYADGVQKDSTIKMPIVQKKKKNHGNVLVTGIRIPKSGKYVLSAMVKADKSFDYVKILVLFRDANGKRKFPGFVIRKITPGKWTPLIADVTIPEGIKRGSFAIEVRDRKNTGTLLIRDIGMAAKFE